MSIASPKTLPQSGTVHVQAVSLRCWMLRDRPLLSLATCLAVIGVIALTYYVSRNPLGTTLAAVALLITLRRAWLPIRFRVDAQGIIRQVSGRSRRVPWSAIARYEVCSRGVVLFPQGADYRIAAGQGLFIPWGGRREELMGLVEKYTPSP
jgi:hypothetical protein